MFCLSKILIEFAMIYNREMQEIFVILSRPNIACSCFKNVSISCVSVIYHCEFSNREIVSGFCAGVCLDLKYEGFKLK